MSRSTRPQRAFSRALAVVGVLMLGLGGAVVGVASSASAVPTDITGHVEDVGGVAVPSVFLEVRDAYDNTVLETGVADLSGDFSIPAVPDGDIVVVARPGGSYVDGFTFVSTTADPATWDVGTIVVDPDGALLTGTVTDKSSGNPIAGILVVAAASDPANTVPDWDGTDASGDYSVYVHKGIDYTLSAQEVSATPTYLPTVWDAPPADPCGCGDVIDVTSGIPVPAGPYDFELGTIDDTIWLSIYAETWDHDDYVGVTVILEQDVAGTWTAVDSAATDSNGFADLFGLGTGDYRLTFVEGSTTRYVTAAGEPSCGCGAPVVYPLTNGGREAVLGTIAAASPGTGPVLLEIDLTFAQPAVPGGGGSPGPPATPRGQTLPRSFAPVSAESSAATPTPTPTPRPSVDPTPTPTATDAPEPEPASAPDLWWLLWVILAVVVILIVGGVIWFFLRRG